MEGEVVSVAIIFFVAAFIQSAMGFGFALIGMPLLVRVIGLKTAAPLSAALALTLTTLLTFRFRRVVQWKILFRLIIGMVWGVPLGALALRYVPEGVILPPLGVVLIGYALYALIHPHLPPLRHPLWGYGAGFLSGLLGGAYNVSGPPVILFVACQGWDPDKFRGNLQIFFWLNSFVVTLTHLLLGNFTATVVTFYLVALPGLLLGLGSAHKMERWLRTGTFRRLVLVALLLLGIRLLLPGG